MLTGIIILFSLLVLPNIVVYADNMVTVRDLKEITDGAESGDPIDQYSLGRIYYKGLLGEQDFKKARKWLSRAAEGNIYDANVLLGDLHYFGQGVPINIGKAFDFYKKAANFGVSDGIERVIDLANTGISEAQFYVGYLYEKGAISNVLGQICDYRNAGKWYLKASENGSDEAKKALERIANECVSNRHSSNSCCSILSYPW